MAYLKKFIVDSFNKDFNYLEWEFSDPAPTSSDSIKIYRSENPGTDISEFDYVDTVLALDGSYVDSQVEDLYLPSRKWYYHLIFVEDATGIESSLTSNPVTYIQGPKDYAAKHILYLKELSLKRFTQRTFYLLKRRTWGNHCNKCWDETLQRSTDPECDLCYGTGWEIGYFNPIRFMAMATPSPSYNQLLPYAKWKAGDTLLTMLNFPIINEDDVIVDDSGDRWIVVQRRSVEKLGRIIEQSAQLSKLMPDDVAYKIPVTEDIISGVITYFNDQKLDTGVIYPTYTLPTLSLSNQDSYIEINKEVGELISGETLISNWQQNDAGPINNYTIYKNGGMVIASSTIFNYDIPDFTIPEGTTRYYSVAEYDQGSIKNDSSGDPYPNGRIEAGSIQSNDVKYIGSRAMFADIDGSIVDIRSLSYKELNVNENSSILISNVTGNMAVVSYPEYLRDISEVILYSGGFEFNITDQMIRQQDQYVNDASGNNPILYKIFTYEPVAQFTDVSFKFII